MFANTIQIHARTVLASSRSRLPAVSQLFHGSFNGQPSKSILHPRLFSTFYPRQRDEDDRAEELTSFRKAVPPSRTLWVGNLPYSVDESELRDMFTPFGELTDIRIGQTADGRTRGFAHVEFSTTEQAVNAMEACKAELFKIQDRPLRIDFAPPRVFVAPEPYHVLYISEFAGDEQDLRSAFKDYESSIVSARLMKNPSTGESYGAGFVEFMNIDRASEVLDALNGTEYAFGTKLKLSYARQRKLGRERPNGWSNQRDGYRRDWGSRGREAYDESGRRTT